MDDRGRLLGIYLKDHLAGATALRDRCRATAKANRGTDLGAFVDRFLNEIVEDRRTLLAIMGRARRAAVAAQDRCRPRR
jgi:hypothetical protein